MQAQRRRGAEAGEEAGAEYQRQAQICRGRSICAEEGAEAGAWAQMQAQWRRGAEAGTDAGAEAQMQAQRRRSRGRGAEEGAEAGAEAQS